MRRRRYRHARGSRLYRERAKRRRRRAAALLLVLTLTGMAMTPQLRAQLLAWLRSGVKAVAAAALVRQESAQVCLPAMRVYALQLGAYENGERAKEEMQRLHAQGVPCVILQREKMRIVCAVGSKRAALDQVAAKAQEAYVIEDALGEVTLEIHADASRIDAVRHLLTLPDALLGALEGEEPLADILARTLETAQAAKRSYADHALAAQLAQSLENWCALIQGMMTEREDDARAYAGAAMYTLCEALRQAALHTQSAPSTASAQRTPSTAAEVMPPA